MPQQVATGEIKGASFLFQMINNKAPPLIKVVFLPFTNGIPFQMTNNKAPHAKRTVSQ